MLRSRSAASHTLITHCLFCAKGDRNPSVLPVLSNLFDIEPWYLWRSDLGSPSVARIWLKRLRFLSPPPHLAWHYGGVQKDPCWGQDILLTRIAMTFSAHTHHQSHVFDQDLLCTSSYNRCRSYAWWFCSLGPQQLYQGLCTTNVTLLQDTSSLLCASGIALRHQKYKNNFRLHWLVCGATSLATKNENHHIVLIYRGFMSLSFMDKVMFVVLKLHLTGNAPLWHSDQADQVAHSQTSHEVQSWVFLPKEEVDSTFHNSIIPP